MLHRLGHEYRMCACVQALNPLNPLAYDTGICCMPAFNGIYNDQDLKIAFSLPNQLTNLIFFVRTESHCISNGLP